MKKVCNFIAQWMGLLVLLVAAVAMFVPASFDWIETKTINPMLGVIMFGMGLTLSPKDFQIVLSRPKDILIGCLAQFTIMPLLAWRNGFECHHLPREGRFGAFRWNDSLLYPTRSHCDAFARLANGRNNG